MFGFLRKKGKINKAEEAKVIDNDIRTAFGKELREENDDGLLFSCGEYPLPLLALSGFGVKVSLVNSPNGITMIREDGQPIRDRRSLTQEDLKKVPKDSEKLEFINLTTPFGEIYSCIITRPDAQIFGSMRAFWWSLAKMRTEELSLILNYTRMTEKAFTRVFANARLMWDCVIEKSGSIDDLRDQLMPTRNMHFEVICKMKEEADRETDKLGLDIAMALVLATQSEDPKLEAVAFDRFKHFFWQPGEEPKEFWHHSVN